MRRILAVPAVAAALLAAGCSSSASKPAAAPQPAATSVAAPVATSSAPAAVATTADVTAPPCSLKGKGDGDIVARWKAPGMPDQAQLLGGVDTVKCKLTFDELQDEFAQGPGYCVQAAWAADNPNYDPEAVPPARLKDVQVSYGDC